MKFSRINFFYGLLATALLHGSVSAFETKIKLAGRKDLVLGIENRQTVLEVGVTYLAEKPDDYLPKIEDLADPFNFKKAAPVEQLADGDGESENPEQPQAVNFDNTSVLEAAAVSFAKKVRGSIARGDARYLQLEGGILLKLGTSFPVRLPLVNEQAFMLKITEITSDGYTLQIGESTKQLSFDDKPQSNSIQFSNP